MNVAAVPADLVPPGAEGSVRPLLHAALRPDLIVAGAKPGAKITASASASDRTPTRRGKVSPRVKAFSMATIPAHGHHGGHVHDPERDQERHE